MLNVSKQLPYYVIGGLAATMCLPICVMAQRSGTNPPGDIKPAQTSSPAANPTGQPSNGSRPQQSTNRSRAQGTSHRNSTVRNQGHEPNLDHQLAAWLLTKNKGEVEVGKLAIERATDAEVKSFAEMMVKDHSAQMAKLQQFIGSDEPMDQRSKIDRQIADACVESLKKELGDKLESDFDACYVGSQISGHMQMSAALSVISQHATGDLGEMVKAAQPIVEKHLQHAKKLMETIDKPGDRSQASSDRETTSR